MMSLEKSFEILLIETLNGEIIDKLANIKRKIEN